MKQETMGLKVFKQEKVFKWHILSTKSYTLQGSVFKSS